MHTPQVFEFNIASKMERTIKKKKIITLTIILLLLDCLFVTFIFAETVILKSGEKIIDQDAESSLQIADIEKASSEAEYLYQQGKELLDEYGGNTLLLYQALPYFKRAIELDKDYIQAYIKISGIMADLAYLRGDEYDQEAVKEAFSWAEKAKEINPDFPDLHRVMAKIYFALERYDTAEEQIKRAIELDANNSDFYYWLGRIYEAKREHNKAIEALNKGIILEPDSESIHDQLGFVYLELRDYTQSLQMYKKALELKPDSAWTWNNYSLPLIKLGRYDEAIEALKKALLIMNFGMAHYNLGRAFMGKEMYKEAEEEFLIINDQESLAMLYQKMGDYGKENKAIEKLLEGDSENAWAYVEKARILKKEKKWDQALFYYQQALEVDPKYALAYHDMGQIYEIRGSVQKAIEYYKKAIETDAKRSISYYDLGRVYEDKVGDHEQAVLYLKKSIELNSQYAPAYYVLAKAYENIEDRENSVPNFEKYLELAPNGDKADFVRGYLKRMQ